MEVTLVVQGNEQELAGLFELLLERGYLHQSWTAELFPPLTGLEMFPPTSRLTTVEQAIVRLDLQGLRRQEIARRLELTCGTVTVYRRTIRLKLWRITPKQQPPWAKAWLRRFPGLQSAPEHTTR